MKCAYVIPTANPALAGECFAAWRAMGWDTYAVVESDSPIENATGIFRQDTYPGWGESFNFGVRQLAGRYDWYATGGDDCFPDPHVGAERIGRELTSRFGGTFGVCQATGDRWAWNKFGAVSPIAFAPFIGAEFARRWNGGAGAFWPGYYQWFADNALYDTAKLAGLFLERPDWTVDHRHVSKVGKPSPAYKIEKHPRWQGDHDLYHAMRSKGFPGHEPIP